MTEQIKITIEQCDNVLLIKLDDIYTMANVTSNEVEESLISENIYNDFMSKKTIVSKECICQLKNEPYYN